MRAVIFAGGAVSDYDFIKSQIRTEDFIIAADSGLEHLVKLGITPDVMIGDMDSVHCEIIGKEIIRLKTMKDDTDTEAAVMLACKRGADEILILGALGSRMDHSLANILLLKKLDDLGIKSCIINENNEIRYFAGDMVLCGKKGDTVSLLPLSEMEEVSNEGLLYPLDNDALSFGTSRGVSNVMLEDKCRITAKKGTALVIKSRD